MGLLSGMGRLCDDEPVLQSCRQKACHEPYAQCCTLANLPSDDKQRMYLVAIAWIYVALMMALAEATSTQGTVLGAIFTFLLYGVLPISIVMYVMATPARREARRRAEAAQAQAAAAPADEVAAPMTSAQPDGSDHAAAGGLAAERKEP
jgi:hypothetical protein